MAIASLRVSPEIEGSGLEPYVLALEVEGLAVVPAEVHRVPLADFDRMVTFLLEKSEELVGCPFSLDRGPHREVEFRRRRGGLNALSEERGEQSQFLISGLASEHRLFRDLAINPVAVALIRHMIGDRTARFSSHNSFVKWRGEYGYGSSLGLHADQNDVPLPWGRGALTANTNWCLTDYTLDGGCLAYVPGSHRFASRPNLPRAAKQAIPVEAPKGSMIVFHGATWHGAFPRTRPGMRISIANYYRHMSINAQEDIKNSFDRSLADDCADPVLFKSLAGFADPFPYARPGREAIPRVRES